MPFRIYKYRLYPTPEQRRTLDKTFEVCRELYNLCLEQRKMQKVSCNEQQKQFVFLKEEFPEYKLVNSDTMVGIIQRLDGAFQRFFRRLQENKNPGYPRFKSANRFNSITYWSFGFRIHEQFLKLSKVGDIKIKLSRDLPTRARTCIIKRSCGKWFACFSVEIPPQIFPRSSKSVGIDVGIAKFATLSDGTFIDNPRFYEKEQKKLRKIQRYLSRCKKGSLRKKKVILTLQKQHNKISSKRSDFLHKTTTNLVRQYGTIAVENLNLLGMRRSCLSKQILDASWGIFFYMLSYKAESANRKIKKVPSWYTSQTCPTCSHISKNNRKSQAKFLCESCGYSANADYVGACNILARAELSDANVQVVN